MLKLNLLIRHEEEEVAADDVGGELICESSLINLVGAFGKKCPLFVMLLLLLRDVDVFDEPVRQLVVTSPEPPDAMLAKLAKNRFS